MDKKPSLDDDYEQALKEPLGKAAGVSKGEKEPIGRVLFRLIGIAFPVLGLMAFIFGFYFLQKPEVSGDSTFAAARLIGYGIAAMIFPIGLWINLKIARWPLGIDDVITELKKLNSTKK